MAAIRELLNNQGLSNVKLIATEMGYYSTPDGMDSGRWNEGHHYDGLTERQQADYSVRTAALLYKDLDHMQFYVINKSQTYDLSEDGFGMTGSYFGKEIPCEGKPVYAVVAAFNDLLGNAEIVQENQSGGSYDYVFETADGGRMHMMWTTNGSATLSYSAETDGVYVYDIYGNRKYMSCSQGTAEIALTGSPVYVENADFAVVDEKNKEINADSTKVKAKAYVTAFNESFCIKKERIADYQAEIRGLAQKYKNKLQILCGVEQEYYSGEPTDGFDYVIGSVHYVKKAGEFFDVDNTPEIFVSGVNKHYNGDFSACAEDYFVCVGDVVRKTRADIIGHFDLITKFNQDGCLFNTQDSRYMAAAKKAVDVLLTCEKPFEVNTGAISRGWRKEAYPEVWILKYIAQMGGRIVLSSDSHSAETLYYKFEEYEQLAKELGFGSLSF